MTELPVGLVDGLVAHPKIDRGDGGYAHEGIGEDIDGYMRDEPWTAKSRHQTAVEPFGFEDADKGKHGGQEGRDGRQPTIVRGDIYSESA